MLRRSLIGLVVLVSAACTSARTGDPDPDGLGAGVENGAEFVESIVMVGDSITVGATAPLDQQFADMGFDDALIVAQSSKRMAENEGDNSSGTDIVRFIAESEERPGREQLWVVALGTNDIGKYGSIDEIVAVMNGLLAPIPPESPVVWINTYLPANQAGTDDINAAIDQVVAARGNAVVGRWSDVAPADGVMSSDGVHPSDEGATVFASLVTSTVAEFRAR